MYPMASFEELRTIAETNTKLRDGIQRVKSEVIATPWDLDGGGVANREMIRHILNRPDVDYPSFEAWLDAVIEEVLVKDALTIKVNRTVSKRIYSLSLLDGATIRPCLDLTGHVPDPPLPAYHQFLNEVPRVDIVPTVSGTDLSQLIQTHGPAAWAYTTDQVLYLPRWKRSWTAYGHPVTERLHNVLREPDQREMDELLDTPSMLRFLRTELFNRVIHDFFNLPDMDWVWITPHESESESTSCIA